MPSNSSRRECTPFFKPEVYCALQKGIISVPRNGIQLPPLSYRCRANSVSPQRLSFLKAGADVRSNSLALQVHWPSVAAPAQARHSGRAGVPRLCAMWHKVTEPLSLGCSRRPWTLQARIHFSLLCGNSFPTAQQVHKFYYGVQPTAITQTQLRFTVYLGSCIKIISLITLHALQFHSSR